MMDQKVRELGADFLALSEIPRGLPTPPGGHPVPTAKQWWRYYYGTDGGSRVWQGPRLRVHAVDGLLVKSCYWRPGGPLHEFEGFLSGLEELLRQRGGTELCLIVEGDFIAKSTL